MVILKVISFLATHKSDKRITSSITHKKNAIFIELMNSFKPNIVVIKSPNLVKTIKLKLFR
jgi:hypothetical protein